MFDIMFEITNNPPNSNISSSHGKYENKSYGYGIVNQKQHLSPMTVSSYCFNLLQV